MPSYYYKMEACYRETEKYITLYLPTDRTGSYDYNKNTGHECKKIIINKENNLVSNTITFIRKDEEERFLERTSKESLGDEIYPIYAKALLQLNYSR